MNNKTGKTPKLAIIIVLAATLSAAAYFGMPINVTGAAVTEQVTFELLGGMEYIPLKIQEALETPRIATEPAPEPPKTVKMTVVGDLMVHEWQADNAYDKNTGTYDFKYCFEPVRQYLSDADYTIGNLETTFTGKDAGYGYYPLFNAPDEFGEALLYAGFDFVTTANNHANDKRKKGILRTLDVLDKLGIEHTGTYRTQEERDKTFIKEINGIRFAFLSYSYGTNGIPLEEPYLVNIIDDELIKADIARAKEHNPDFIIVLPHIGNEYDRYTRDVFKNRIKTILEAGADIVLASHPHVLQPMEFVDVERDDGNVERCFAAYSLGNFISSQRTYPRDEGIILNIVFEKEDGKTPAVTDISYIPTWVKFINSAGRYDIQTLSVFDALKAHENGADTGLRSSDVSRLKQVHRDISKMLYGNEIPLEEIRNEYWLMSSD